MNTREQFGKYLLLKKLTEDSLGETFRAGMLGSQGMERVVLLRIFNGQAISGARLWEAVSERGGVQQVLRSPNIGEGVELGEIQGIPYTAYDYVSGKNLANLLQQAAKRQSFIPTEHALLITERIALALALAGESRFQGGRVLHGFLVPQLVMISNEGETRLVGFEVAPGLRGFSANPVVRQHFGRYLSPEAMAGEPIEASDDIYSLGVLLYELLTGAPLPAPAADGYGSVIDQAKLATEGTPFPNELKELLGRSLVARDDRQRDVVAWHKDLNRWMFEGQYNPTTFNLAFFMHNLFRQEIERESQEIEVEKTLPLPVVQTGSIQTGTASASGAQTGSFETASPAEPTPASTPATGAVPVATAAPDTTTVDTSDSVPVAAPPAEKKSKAGLWLTLAALLLAGLGAAYYFLYLQKAEPTPAVQQTAKQLMPKPEPVSEPTPDTTAAEAELAAQEAAAADIQAKIDEMIEQKTTAMEAQFRQKFDDELKSLQDELDRAKEATAQRERELQLAQQEAQAAAVEPPAEEPAAETAESATVDTKPAATPVAETAVAETATAASPPSDTAAVKTNEPAATPATTNPVETSRPKVRRGDLVKMGDGVVEPKVLRQANPRFPEMARRVGKEGGTVTVRVLVDENGKVLRTELVNKLGFGFDGEALNAAKNATWAPATKYGVPVKMWKEINVTFQR